MVVLDEDPVVEAEAVVRAAATANRVLLEGAQSRRGLASVEDRCAGAGDGVDVARGPGRDSRQAAEEVERRTLAGKDRPREPGHLGDDGPIPVAVVAVGSQRLEFRL